MKTAKLIEESQASKESPEITPENTRKHKQHDASRIAAWQWKPGQSGNPGGRPKSDVAAAICRAAFENNAEAIYEGLTRDLIAGKAYTLQVASDRGYGKLKETKEITHIHQDVPDTDLEKRISELIADLGLAAQIDAVGGTEVPQTGAVKTNGHAKDSDLLPR